MRTYCLIDASNLIHRARHAVNNKEYRAPTPKAVAGYNLYENGGGHTEVPKVTAHDVVSLGLHTTFQSMHRVFQQMECDHVVMCFDDSSWRRVFYPDYKRKRREKRKDDDLIQEVFAIIDEFYEFLSTQTNVTVLRKKGVEADDFIARWTALHQDEHSIIISTDSDYRQLVSGHTTIYDPMAEIIFRPDGIYDKLNGFAGRSKVVKRIGMTKWIQRTTEHGDVILPDPGWTVFKKAALGKQDEIDRSSPKGLGETRLQRGWDELGWVPVSEVDRGIFDREAGENWELIREKFDEEHLKLFDRNIVLSHLLRQPEDVIESIDEAILEATDPNRQVVKRDIGFNVMKFCRDHHLPTIAEGIRTYAPMLAGAYGD